jgi:hypothetical protein
MQSCYAGVTQAPTNSTNSNLRDCFDDSECSYEYIGSCFSEDARTSGTITFAFDQYSEVWRTLLRAEVVGGGGGSHAGQNASSCFSMMRILQIVDVVCNIYP